MLLLPFCMLYGALNGICFVNCACCIFVYQIFMRTLYSVFKNDIMQRLEDIIKERVLILDGAMGTMIQQCGLTEEDFRGERFTHLPGL